MGNPPPILATPRPFLTVRYWVSKMVVCFYTDSDNGALLCPSLCKKTGRILLTQKANGLKCTTFRNLHRLRQRGIFRCLSLCKKRDTFYWLKRDWVKIPDVQKFTRGQTNGKYPFIWVCVGKRGTFYWPKRGWLKIRNFQKFTHTQTKGVILRLSLCKKRATFYWFKWEWLKIPDVQKFTRVRAEGNILSSESVRSVKR